MKLAIWSVLALTAAAALTQRERDARFYFDLGPEQIDVSGYPARQQESYKLFAARCSQCHTLARPINAPITTEHQWQRFVHRMHKNMLASSKDVSSTDEESRIVEFLAFDARARKIDNADFRRQSDELKERFERVKAERRRELAAESQREALPPVNENAQPAPQP